MTGKWRQRIARALRSQSADMESAMDGPSSRRVKPPR